MKFDNTKREIIEISKTALRFFIVIAYITLLLYVPVFIRRAGWADRDTAVCIGMFLIVLQVPLWLVALHIIDALKKDMTEAAGQARKYVTPVQDTIKSELMRKYGE